MNWKSFSSRLLLVVVAFPVLGVLIFLAPGLHLLPYTIAVVAASVVGALETRGLFRARGITTTPYLAPFLAGTLPLSVWLEVTGMIPSGWARAWLVACIGVILVRATLQKDARRIEEFLSFTSSSVFILLYPSYFLSWVVRFTALPQPSLSILLFLGLVFGNDMAAYFAGSLWGGSTQLNLAISPQKSVVGFIAGLMGTGIIYTIFRLAVPSLLPGKPRGSNRFLSGGGRFRDSRGPRGKRSQAIGARQGLRDHHTRKRRAAGFHRLHALERATFLRADAAFPVGDEEGGFSSVSLRRQW